jgi:hypothetical protein
MASSLVIRPATSKDLPRIAQIDIAANPVHPLVSLPWAHPDDAYAVLFPRYELFFSAPFMHFLVAEEIKGGAEAEIGGFASWNGLYEKFGWRSFEEVRIDLSEFGIKKPYVTWDMMREVGGA